MIAPIVALLLQVATPSVAAPAAHTFKAPPEFPVQLGSRLTPDTVTVGQRFLAVIKVHAPRGARIEFPTESDSTAKATATATQMIGKPAVKMSQDSTGVTGTAAYRLAAWDVGPQGLGIGDVVVKANGRTGYVSLASKQVPKPARPAIEIKPFDWLPWLIALAALVLAAILWRLWVWWRRRQSAPLDPFTAAEREFVRIESMGLAKSGEPERHAALMSDVMREYLSARAPGVERSQTSSELLASADWIHGVATGLGELLWRTDLVKFAAARIEPDEAEKLGGAARSVVLSVETHLVEQEKADEERKAA